MLSIIQIAPTSNLASATQRSMSNARQMALADTIRRLRKKAGLSQRALGDRLGVHNSAVAHWEAGGGITLARLADLAVALDADLPALLAEGPNIRELVEEPDELAVLAAWRRLAAEDRPTVLRLVLGMTRRADEAKLRTA
jgi:transcriptional regulator with XRE-family HTH domain